jgi:hypothetical protein
MYLYKEVKSVVSDEFYRVHLIVSGAKDYRDVFTVTESPTMAQLGELKKTYRQLVRHVHPDRVEVSMADVARSAYDRLDELYADAINAVNNGTFGKMPAKLSFATAVGEHVATYQLNDWCDMSLCYRAESALKDGPVSSFVKMAKTPRDNDLLAAEATALGKIYSGAEPARTVFFPSQLDSFGMSMNGTRLRVNVFGWLDGFYNLEQVKRAHPTGVMPIDVAWMWRRILWALDYAHTNGIVHGAVLPQNVMILPEQHGVVLVDWCYAKLRHGSDYGALSAVVGTRRDWYPADVFDKKPVSPSLDIALAAKTAIYLMGGDPIALAMPPNVPAAYAAYFSRYAKLKLGSDVVVADAAIEFDQLLKKLGPPFYPRKFRPFSV